MSFPVRTLSGVCEISTASFLINSMPKAHEGENGAIDVVVQFKYQGQSYAVDSLKAEMYLLYPSQGLMTDTVELNINGDTARGIFPEEFMMRAGCPLLVVKLTDPTTGQQIIACHVPIHVDNVLGSVVITTRPPTPSEIVYVGRSPYIENGNWYTFDTQTSSFIDTGVEARGPQGPAGPAGSVTGILVGGETYQPDEAGVVALPDMGGGVPDGGTKGQMIFKTGNEDGAAEWDTPTHDKVGALGSDPAEDGSTESPEMGSVPINADQLGGMTYQMIVDLIYPIGRTITTLADEDDPNALYPWQTWERTAQGRMLIGTGAPENNDDGSSPGIYNYAAGNKGGVSSQSVKKENLPKLRIPVYVDSTLMSWEIAFESGTTKSGMYSTSDGRGRVVAILDGGEQPIDIMNPYIAANIWKRVS